MQIFNDHRENELTVKLKHSTVATKRKTFLVWTDPLKQPPVTHHSCLTGEYLWMTENSYAIRLCITITHCTGFSFTPPLTTSSRCWTPWASVQPSASITSSHWSTERLPPISPRYLFLWESALRLSLRVFVMQPFECGVALSSIRLDKAALCHGE